MSETTLVPEGDETGQFYAPTSESREVDSAGSAALAEARVRAAYVSAISRPRVYDMVRQRLLRECDRSTFAAVATYSKPVGGGKNAIGPSIRFAEVALRCYGNLEIDSAVVLEDEVRRVRKISICDLETNIRYSVDVVIAKAVERANPDKTRRVISSRRNSRGEMTYLIEATEDETFVKDSALASKVLRQLAIRLIPSSLISEAQERCAKVRAEEMKRDPDATRKKIADSFLSIGISADELIEFVGHPLDVLTIPECEELRTLFSAIEQGDARWREVKDARLLERSSKRPEAEPDPSSPTPTEPPKTVDSLLERTRQRRNAKKPETTAPTATSPTAAAPTAPAPSPAPVVTRDQAIETLLEHIDNDELAAQVADTLESEKAKSISDLATDVLVGLARPFLKK